MTCLRCKASPMYQVVGTNGAKATCSSCSQWVDCAQCSNPQCGDTKCLSCYNKALLPGRANQPSRGPLVSDESEF